ncbi:MAG: glutaminyl-peptide cyclotransferase [Candidatus Kapabacteria bacterium]|nr:glutaminyl-peptide cyclotransferase [Candidatus Kapabacteria bacterium]
MTRLSLPIILCAIIVACSSERKPEELRDKEKPTQILQTESTVTSNGFKVLRRYPHDVKAFTQGLEVYDGLFVESTGQNGLSSIRRVEIGSGKVKKVEDLDDAFFGEGATVLKGKIYMLTWLNQMGFVFDAQTLKSVGKFSYAGEGWGLTNDGTRLIMSNGSSILNVIDPNSYRVVRSISVTMNGSPVTRLNELEWVDGEIWANIWQSEQIVRIDPASGRVNGVIDLTGILPDSARDANTDVLNGIAFDSATKAIYVTGKNWPYVFQISLQ